MSVRLFHRGGRVVLSASRGSSHLVTWRAFHIRPIAWQDVFRPALVLLGFAVETEDGALRFGDPSTTPETGPSTEQESKSGSLRWTRGAFWTTIRLQLPQRLPPSSQKKMDLLAAALLKAARYRSAATDVQPVRARSA